MGESVLRSRFFWYLPEVTSIRASMKPRILVDQDIPGAVDIFSGFGEVQPVPGHDIDARAVRHADVLVVRSITRVDASLLAGSSVGFVGTATAGLDHMDIDFLTASGIAWASAPGANAESVVEYVLATIAVIASRRSASLHRKTLGIIGCGDVGERLAVRAESIGMRVLRNDPPRADREGADAFVELNRLLPKCDIISIHVPLVRSGMHPTEMLVGPRAFGLIRSSAWLIQTSRGGTMDEVWAARARTDGRLDALVLDVFAGEPHPDPAIVEAADVATGHIAGYSRDAKRNGLLMIRDALERYLGLGTPSSSAGGNHQGVLKRPLDSRGQPVPVHDPSWLDMVLRQVIDVRSDDTRFRRVVASSNPVEGFHAYRANYPARYSWSRYAAWPDATGEEVGRLCALGFTIGDEADVSGQVV